ncbi:unnamed protein product [Pieris macdunnoughi]|uniref:Uncharacterized protein n=1 Tax=Pieris macdunnoughi TaxID=345717 RepID=A0A821LNI7_9NEOP|nr:unnamed protein product [Pieris macdunnoughi]
MAESPMYRVVQWRETGEGGDTCFRRTHRSLSRQVTYHGKHSGCRPENGPVGNRALQKPQTHNLPKTTRKYNTKNADWEEFRDKINMELTHLGLDIETIKEVDTKARVNSIVMEYTKTIIKAAEKHIPKVKQRKKSFDPPWWNKEIEALKKDMTRKKKRISYAAPRRRECVVNAYLEAKKTYEEEIERAQKEGWKKLCTKQEGESLWDRIYKIIRKAEGIREDTTLIEKGISLNSEESVQLLARKFFPPDNCEMDDDIHQRMTVGYRY